jgi:hypothetical protein
MLSEEKVTMTTTDWTYAVFALIQLDLLVSQI